MTRWIVAGLACLLWLPTAIALPVTVTANNLVTRAYDDALVDSDSSASTAVDGVDITVESNAGATTSRVVMNLSGSAASGGSAVFDFDLAQSFDNSAGAPGPFSVGARGDFADASDMFLSFTADVDSVFNFSASFALLGASPARIFIQAQLADLTAATNLFVLSQGAIDQSLASVMLAESGLLVAGHDYQLFVQAFIQSRDANGQATLVAASAGGNITLSLNEVPEPATLALLGAALFACGAGRRRFRRGSSSGG